MATITLAKALKYKNRLIERIAWTAQQIQQWNSIVDGAEREVDVEQMMEDYDRFVASLITLKVVIVKANGPIQWDIFRMSEVKGQIELFRKLNTRHGKTLNESTWRDEAKEVVYKAVARKAEVDESIRRLQTELDEIQDRLDAHNHTTHVEVEVII